MAVVEWPLDAADECQLVGDLGLERHQFRDVKAGDVRLNWTELAA